MSLLRSILRVKPINRLARATVCLLPPAQRQRVQRKLPLVDPFTITLPNRNMIRFVPHGDICSKFLRFDGWNGYERPSIELFYALAQHAQVTFDVGAYLGYFGLLAAAAAPGNRAYLFEAVPKLAALAEQIAKQNSHLQVEVVAAAVADRSGTIPLYLADDPFDSDTSTNAGHRPNRQRVDVPAITLDDFVAQKNLPRVDLLKIDTETTEPAVLAGFAKTISAARPAFLCEVLPTANLPALEQFKAAHRYASAWVTADGLIAKTSLVPDAALKDLNYLFYPQELRGPMGAAIAQWLKA